MLAQSLKAKRGFFAAGLSLTSASSQIMSRLVWEYEGANEEKHGEQCVFVGDKVHHDSHGEGIAVRMDGAMIIIEFVEDGERIEKHQTKGHVYALVQRERAQQKRTGRRLEGQVGLLASTLHCLEKTARLLSVTRRRRSDSAMAPLARRPRQLQ